MGSLLLATSSFVSFIKGAFLLTTKLYKQILKDKLKRGEELMNDTNIESQFKWYYESLQQSSIWSTEGVHKIRIFGR